MDWREFLGYPSPSFGTNSCNFMKKVARKCGNSSHHLRNSWFLTDFWIYFAGHRINRIFPCYQWYTESLMFNIFKFLDFLSDSNKKQPFLHQKLQSDTFVGQNGVLSRDAEWVLHIKGNVLFDYQFFVFLFFLSFLFLTKIGQKAWWPQIRAPCQKF